MMLAENNVAAREADFIGRMPAFPGHFHGRGIVTCAGGVKYLTCAWIQIALLRRLGCMLPIEVWYLGEDEGDASWVDLVRPLGADCVDAFAFRSQAPHRRLRGWEAKVYAILLSRFEEVLFLDADNVAVVDPTPLFDLAEYGETGAVFWPDATVIPKDHPAWRVFNVVPRQERAFETGQILVNKNRCWRSLQLCNWYNENSDFYYRYVHGDKETFQFAWRRLCQPFTLAPVAPKAATFGLIQFDPAGRRLFQHRIRDKWRLTGNRSSGEFWHEKTCLELLAWLAEQWDPTEHLTRNLSAQDRLQMETVSGRTFRLGLPGGRSFEIELRSDRWVGGSSALLEHFWWCSQGRLVLAGADGRPIAELAVCANGIWRGRSAARDGAEVRLVPLRRIWGTLPAPRLMQAKPRNRDQQDAHIWEMMWPKPHVARLDRRSIQVELPTGCFNPSIVRYQGRLLCAYRKLVSASENYICLVHLDDQFRPQGEGRCLTIPGPKASAACWEDPRLFCYRDRLFCSFTYWVPSLGSAHTVVGLCEIMPDLGVERVRFPSYGCNRNRCTGGTAIGQEKNWVFFESREKLYFVYGAAPFEVIEYDFDLDRVIHWTKTRTAKRWAWGTIRGGTPPVQVGSRYYSFYHSSLRHHGRHGRWTYYVGVLTFSPKRPFRVDQMSSQPLLSGHWEPGCEKAVVFPGGAVYDDSGWSVACGINDRWCAILRFTSAEIQQHLERNN